MGLEGTSLPGETGGFQGVLQAAPGVSQSLRVAFQTEPEYPGPVGVGECPQQACFQAEGWGVGGYGIDYSEEGGDVVIVHVAEECELGGRFEDRPI